MLRLHNNRHPVSHLKELKTNKKQSQRQKPQFLNEKTEKDRKSERKEITDSNKASDRATVDIGADKEAGPCGRRAGQRHAPRGRRDDNLLEENGIFGEKGTRGEREEAEEQV